MVYLFGILDLDHWDLFEPARVRLVWRMRFTVSGLEMAAINTSGANSVWARDSVFGAWNFHDFHQTGNLRGIGRQSQG